MLGVGVADYGGSLDGEVRWDLESGERREGGELLLGVGGGGECVFFCLFVWQG